MCLFVHLLHTILSLFFYLCKQKSLWSISWFLLCANYWMKFNQNLSIKKRFSDLESNINIDVIKKENLKPLNLIGGGTNTKLMFKFKKDCLKFYVTAVQHLQSRLPLDIPFVKHTQFLHPEKYQLPGAASAISNLALSICSVHKTCLQDVFLTKSLVTSEKVCDLVRNQWVVYQ